MYVYILSIYISIPNREWFQCWYTSASCAFVLLPSDSESPVPTSLHSLKVLFIHRSSHLLCFVMVWHIIKDGHSVWNKGLADQRNSRTAVWKYFATEANEKVKVKRASIPICKHCNRPELTEDTSTEKFSIVPKRPTSKLLKRLLSSWSHFNITLVFNRMAE